MGDDIQNKIKSYLGGDFTETQKRDNNILVNALYLISWIDAAYGYIPADMLVGTLKNIAKSSLSELARRIVDTIANAVYDGASPEHVSTDIKDNRYKGIRQSAEQLLQAVTTRSVFRQI